MTKQTEKQRLFSIVAYSDQMSPVQARIIYLSEHKEDISMQRVRQLLVEMADDGTLSQPRKGIYRIPA
jgi:hypothetical protein